MPFFETEYWTSYKPLFPVTDEQVFWSDYNTIYREGLNEYEKNKIQDYNYLFFEIIP